MYLDGERGKTKISNLNEFRCEDDISNGSLMIYSGV